MSSRKKSARSKALMDAKLGTLRQLFSDISMDVIELTLEQYKGDLEKSERMLTEMNEELRKVSTKDSEPSLSAAVSDDCAQAALFSNNDRLSDPNETIVFGGAQYCLLPISSSDAEITSSVRKVDVMENHSDSDDRREGLSSTKSIKFQAPLWQSSDISSSDRSQTTDIDYLESLSSSSALECSSSSGSRFLDKENDASASPFTWQPPGQNAQSAIPKLITDDEHGFMDDTAQPEPASDNDRAGSAEGDFWSVPMSLQLDKDLAYRLMMTFGLMQVPINIYDNSNLSIKLDMETAYRLYHAWKNTQESSAVQAELVENSDEHLARALQDLEHESYAEQDLKSRSMKEIMDETYALRLMEKESENRGLDVASALMYQSDDGLQSKYAGVLLKSYNMTSDSAFPPLDTKLKNVFAGNCSRRSKDLENMEKKLLDDPPDGLRRPNSAGSTELMGKIINIKPVVANSGDNANNKGPRTDPVDYYGKREKAIELQRKALEFGARAGKAYTDRKLGGGVAAHYLQQAHEHKYKSREAHFDASLEILADRNSNVSDGEIDLHGLRMDEVGTALEDFFARKHKSKELKIITGRGLHSRHGVSEVRRAVEIYLNKYDHKYVEGPPDGVFYVDKRQKLHTRPP